MPSSESHNNAECLEVAEAIYKKALVRHLASEGKGNILDVARAATQVENFHHMCQFSEMRQRGLPVTARDTEDMTLAAEAHRIDLHHAEMKQYVAIMSYVYIYDTYQLCQERENKHAATYPYTAQTVTRLCVYL